MRQCSNCLVDKDDASFYSKGSLCKDCSIGKERERYAKRQADDDMQMVAAIVAGGESLAAFGQPAERDIAATLVDCGSVIACAELLGHSASRVRRAMTWLLTKAARRGYSPEHDMSKAVPVGYHVKGVSTMYDADGKIRAQWVKSNKDQDQQYADLIEEAQRAFGSMRGALDPAVAPTVALNADLLVVYPMGDPHIGMFSWSEETGADFDLKIAESNLCAGIDQLVAGAPASKHALIINLGDYFHADNSSNQTTRSHHALDVDTRWAKVLRVGLRTFRRVIDRALEKHERVTVICEIGNHDDHSAIMLALALEQAYEREPRVVIDTSPAKFHWYEFGNVMIASTHTDSIKMSDVPMVMAQDQPAMWGRTRFRYAHTGHRHQDALLEKGGVIAECHRTFAPRDAWAAGKGYGSGRSMKSITYHRRYGEVCRHTVGILQIEKGSPTDV